MKAKAEELLKQAHGRRRFRRAREEVLRGRGQREERRRSRLLRPRPDGAGVRSGGVRDAAGPDQRSGQDAVRLPHHQADRQEAGDHAHARRSAAADRPISSPTSARRRRPPTSRRTLAKQIKKPADLDKVAKAQGLTVQESGFFARDEPILGLGPSPEAATKAFELKTGEVGGPLRTSRGFAFETLVAQAGSARRRSSTR